MFRIMVIVFFGTFLFYFIYDSVKSETYKDANRYYGEMCQHQKTIAMLNAEYNMQNMQISVPI